MQLFFFRTGNGYGKSSHKNDIDVPKLHWKATKQAKNKQTSKKQNKENSNNKKSNKKGRVYVAKNRPSMMKNAE